MSFLVCLPCKLLCDCNVHVNQLPYLRCQWSLILGFALVGNTMRYHKWKLWYHQWVLWLKESPQTTLEQTLYRAV